MTISLPIHAITGDRALGFRRDGRPIWPIKGGSGEGDPGAGDGKGADGDPGKGSEGDPGKGTEGDPGTDPEAELGDAGKKALQAERTARKDAEKARDEAQAEVKRLQRANAAVKGTDLEAIKADIRAEFATALAETALKAEAKGRLVNPAVVTKFVDASTLAGADEAKVKAAVDDVLKEHPYLAAPESGAKPWGDVGGGKTPSTEAEPTTPEERMRRAYGKKAAN